MSAALRKQLDVLYNTKGSAAIQHASLRRELDGLPPPVVEGEPPADPHAARRAHLEAMVQACRERHDLCSVLIDRAIETALSVAERSPAPILAPPGSA